MSMQKTLLQLTAIATALDNTGLFSPFSGFKHGYNDTGFKKRTCPNCGKKFESINAFCTKECFIETRLKQKEKK